MATNAAERRYRTWYAILLRLYPRPFRERFSEGMAQTFHDLCREHEDAKRGLRGLVLWIFFETSVGIVKENTVHMSQLVKTILRVALGALAVLMVPLVASRVVKGWNWSAGSFVFVYVLFFATGMVYVVIARKMGVWSYKAAVGVALVTGFGLGGPTWSMSRTGKIQRTWCTTACSRWGSLVPCSRAWRREGWLARCSRWRPRLL
jgi:hypothetical protein